MRRILLLAAVLGFALLARPVVAAPLSLATIHGPVTAVHGPQDPCSSASTPC